MSAPETISPDAYLSSERLGEALRPLGATLEMSADDVDLFVEHAIELDWLAPAVSVIDGKKRYRAGAVLPFLVTALTLSNMGASPALMQAVIEDARHIAGLCLDLSMAFDEIEAEES